MRPLTLFAPSRVLFVLCLALGAAATSVSGQLIPIKTVPVAAGDQFMIFPTDNPGLGGLSIAVHDRALDPFGNPGAGARTVGGWVSAAPGFYLITGDNGGARTLPLAAAAAGSRWFGGGAVAFQELDIGSSAGFAFPGGESPLSASRASNAYASVYGGARLSRHGPSLGVGLHLADLGGLDGVTLLYDPGATVEQSGHRVDLRMGLFQEWDDSSTAEIVLLHDRFDMTHHVTGGGWWVPRPDILPGGDPGREELDKTRTWGVHLAYQRPVGESGWRVGGILTGNWKTHPGIPDYDLMQIPRDPGNSWAYDVGVGLARRAGGTTLGVDLIYEPIWSDTWAETEQGVVRWDGTVIPAGGRTVENDFRFSNWVARMGVGQQGARWGIQLGLDVHSYSYELEQLDHVTGAFRQQDEAWIEWTPTWALSVMLGDLSLQYAGNLTSGAGRPGTATPVFVRGPGLDTGSDFLVAPQGPLTLQDASVTTHRVTIRVPLG